MNNEEDKQMNRRNFLKSGTLFGAFIAVGGFSLNSITNAIGQTDELPFEKRHELDRWILSELNTLISKNITTEMHYNIQIHLPETRDVSVYDAIFESLKKHLL